MAIKRNPDTNTVSATECKRCHKELDEQQSLAVHLRFHCPETQQNQTGPGGAA